jgi:hypothetical protein
MREVRASANVMTRKGVVPFLLVRADPVPHRWGLFERVVNINGSAIAVRTETTAPTFRPRIVRTETLDRCAWSFGAADATVIGRHAVALVVEPNRHSTRMSKIEWSDEFGWFLTAFMPVSIVGFLILISPFLNWMNGYGFTWYF